MNTVTDYAVEGDNLVVLLDDGDKYSEYPISELISWATENKYIGDNVPCVIGEGGELQTILRHVNEEEFIQNLDKFQIQEFVNSKL